MDIRVLDGNDAAGYFELRLEGLRDEPRAFGRSYEEYVLSPPEQVASRLKSGPGNVTLGAFEGGKMVGTMTLLRHDTLKERHKAAVLAAYVTPAARGRGVGAALLRELIAHARTMDGVEQLTLAVSVTQEAARRTYARAGFEVFGREPRALLVNGEYIDEEYMVLLL